VVVDPHHRKVFLLNRVGAVVWAGVERGATEGEIVIDVVARFRVESDRARADVDRFMVELEQSGLAVRDAGT
jgi:hypothetical protein